MMMLYAYAWSLIALLGQGAILGGALALMLRLLRNASSVRRYNACALALAATMACWMFTFATLMHTTSARRVEDSVAAPLTTLPTPIASAGANVILRADRYAPAAAWFCLACSVLLLCRAILGLAAARSLVQNARSSGAGRMDRMAAGLARRLTVRQPFRLLASPSVSAPVVMGWLNPVILVPINLPERLTTAQLEAVLAHELAHILRRDFLANTLQACIEAVLWIQPCAWWASRRMRQEREHLCDDIAVRIAGSPVVYAHALTTLEQHRAPANLNFSLGASGGSLAMRIERILQTTSSTLAGPRLATTCGIGLIALSGVCVFSLATIQQLRAQTPAPAPPAAVTTTHRPGLACTYYAPGPRDGQPGTCIADSSIPEGYACRQNAAPHRVGPQIACEWKVKRLQRWMQDHPGAR